MRALQSDVGLTASSAPTSTPTLMDTVFKSITPMNNGLTFGEGLTPFAIVCDGHEGA